MLIPSREIVDRFGNRLCRDCGKPIIQPPIVRAPMRSRHPRIPMSWGLRRLVDRIRPETLNSGTAGQVGSSDKAKRIKSGGAVVAGAADPCCCSIPNPCSSCAAAGASISLTITGAITSAICVIPLAGTYTLTPYSTSGACSGCLWTTTIDKSNYPLSGITCYCMIVFNPKSFNDACAVGCEVVPDCTSICSGVIGGGQLTCVDQFFYSGGGGCNSGAPEPIAAFTPTQINTWCTSGGSISTSTQGGGTTTVTA